jgi:hypothetical protein
MKIWNKRRKNLQNKLEEQVWTWEFFAVTMCTTKWWKRRQPHPRSQLLISCLLKEPGVFEWMSSARLRQMKAEPKSHSVSKRKEVRRWWTRSCHRTKTTRQDSASRRPKSCQSAECKRPHCKSQGNTHYWGKLMKGKNKVFSSVFQYLLWLSLFGVVLFYIRTSFFFIEKKS